MGAPLLAVVIPYYQEQAGLLCKCLHSVLRQREAEKCEIIVVDDGSPISAESELAKLKTTDAPVRLLKQENAGAGAARNLGLDSVTPGTNYVAFLDSDDQWQESFLSDAIYSLDSGCDIFVGNSSRYNKETSRFEWDPLPQRNIYPEKHKLLNDERKLYEFVGDFFDLAIYRSNLISTSTLAYRLDKHSALRFSSRLYNGQDRLFKLQLSKSSQRVSFSPNIYAQEGRGINIFDSAQWGSNKSLRLLSSYIRLPKEICRLIDLSTEQHKHVITQLRSSRASFSKTILHLLAHRQPVNWKLVTSTWKDDPASFIYLFPVLAEVASRRIINKLKSR